MEDLTTVKGFMTAVALVLSVSCRGLVHVGHPCASFVWISRSRTKRSRRAPLGDLRNPSVKTANLLSARTVLLLALCVVRRVFWTLEQPGSSLLPYVPSLERFMKLCEPFHKCYQGEFWMGAFGHFTLKPSLLIGNAPWIPALALMGKRLDVIKSMFCFGP